MHWTPGKMTMCLVLLSHFAKFARDEKVFASKFVDRIYFDLPYVTQRTSFSTLKQEFERRGNINVYIYIRK